MRNAIEWNHLKRFYVVIVSLVVSSWAKFLQSISFRYIFVKKSVNVMLFSFCLDIPKDELNELGKIIFLNLFVLFLMRKHIFHTGK